VTYKLNYLALAHIAVVALATGCRPSAERESYKRIWISPEQANPSLFQIARSDPKNLLDTGRFTSEAKMTAQHAVNSVLAAEMQSHGLNVDLDGLAAMLTRQLKEPDETDESELKNSAWMLGIRNVFWSTTVNKYAEMHTSSTGEKLLVLWNENRALGKCYIQEKGNIIEYVLGSAVNDEVPSK
jgi:hypothetical protein